MRKILIFQLLLLVFASCKQAKSKKVLICGYAMNGVGSKMVLYMNDQPVDSTILDDKSKFCLRLDSLSEGLYNFKIGNDYQYLYLKQGDSIALSSNIFNFDESLAFSGRGSNINNFMLSMYLKSEKEKKILNNFYFLPLPDFTKKIDSLVEIRTKLLNDFKIKEQDETVWELAKISATYDLFAMKESYAKFYKKFKGKSENIGLPEHYYAYRKDVQPNCKFFYHRSYFNYAQAYINNESYDVCFEDKKHPDISQKDFYHFHKLDLIDSVYGENEMLKKNLYKRAVYSYFFNLSDENNIGDYISQVKKYIGEYKDQSELDSLFVAAEKLKEGNTLPHIKLIDVSGQERSIDDVLSSHQINVLYMVPFDGTEISSYVKSRILQLKTLLPEVNYIGLTIGGNYEKWKNMRTLEKFDFFVQNPKIVSRKLLFYSPNKVIIIDKRNKIMNAFGNIFSSDLERKILKN